MNTGTVRLSFERVSTRFCVFLQLGEGCSLSAAVNCEGGEASWTEISYPFLLVCFSIFCWKKWANRANLFIFRRIFGVCRLSRHLFSIFCGIFFIDQGPIVGTVWWGFWWLFVIWFLVFCFRFFVRFFFQVHFPIPQVSPHRTHWTTYLVPYDNRSSSSATSYRYCCTRLMYR